MPEQKANILTAQKPQARVAFADLNFSWPPNGGADVDLYHIASGLQTLGYTVCLFGAHEQGSSDRGRFDPAQLPFPAVRLVFGRRTFTAARVAQAFQQAVDAWQPDLVFVQHGYALKPYVMKALAHHRTVGRYYAHELACARDAFRFKEGAPCPQDYLRTPDICRLCALESQKEVIQRGYRPTWTADYLAAQAFAPEYHAKVIESLKTLNAIIVSNRTLAQHVDGFHTNVKVIPGGVDAACYVPRALPEKGPRDKKIILMTGRAEDPAKGLGVLLEAGRILERRRSDFEIWATHFNHGLSTAWLKTLGWRNPSEMNALYAASDVCVVPSLWEEPFGLVAVEAMASARPVVASAAGGLKEIIRHGETGFLFQTGDSAELAKEIEILLENFPLRARMGEAGRHVAEQEYDWQNILSRHYTPLIEDLMR